MNDRDHEEWLEGEAERKAAHKKQAKPLPPKDDDRKKPDDTGEEDSIRSWVID